MELAGQWRREWAGTAEYGNVTQDGVTRRVARAMEVLHASAPGARVRVMRAAYHSTSGQGHPASSFMMHSSRRVISSGFNLLESPTYPTKPLEISSMPLESSPVLETENYKVTEPDDFEISEPSKWRGSTNGSTVRMPSEESSSTDNASIIDLDRLSHKGISRKYSNDSENSEVYSFTKTSARASPLLESPTTLSTLKYKSLLNGSNDWNNRRKSYSFEDTSPLNEILLQSNDTLAMESSTDSGICKSTEVVNDYAEDLFKGEASPLSKFKRANERAPYKRINMDDSASDDWPTKNSSNIFYKSSKLKPYEYKEHSIVLEEPSVSNISLQSTGKVTITVPITIEKDSDNCKYDDSDRKVKKVGFCKTELHFAAESGKVNIIATDEKPPPTSDFRRRRSAFVPIHNKIEKPVTLFGERTETLLSNTVDEYKINGLSGTLETDENTAATKSILKNKIPKPKPYLLGENMAFGDLKEDKEWKDSLVTSGVSLINKELRTKGFNVKEKPSFEFSNGVSLSNSFRTNSTGSTKDHGQKCYKVKCTNLEDMHYNQAFTTNEQDSMKKQLNVLHGSSKHTAKTRQLRESELTYFGIEDNKNITDKKLKQDHKYTNSQLVSMNDSFESVRLIKQISNSAQNSETDSEDFPEYQNIHVEKDFAPVPKPRTRVKQKDQGDVIPLKPILENSYQVSAVNPEVRRSRSKRQDEAPATRSLSEPAKKRLDNTIHRNDELRSSIGKGSTKQRSKYNENRSDSNSYPTTTINKKADNVPIYVNLKTREFNKQKHVDHNDSNDHIKKSAERPKAISGKFEDKDKLLQNQNSFRKSYRTKRTEKLSTPENNTLNRNKEETIPKKAHRSSLERGQTKNDQISKDLFIKKESKQYSKIKTDDENSFDRRTNHSSKYSTTISNGTSKKYIKPSSEQNIASKEQQSIKKVVEDISEKNTNSRKPSRRSEYVIQYDDKNGTVSSVCKVRSGHSASKKMTSSRERKRENVKDSKEKDKILEKSVLLLPPEHHRIVKGRDNSRKWNTRSLAQRSCTLL